MKNAYSNFLNELSKGNVLHAHDANALSVQPLPKKLRIKNWAIPSYDFGHLLDPSHPDFLADRVREFDYELSKAEEMTVADAREVGFALPSNFDSSLPVAMYATVGPINFRGDAVFIIRHTGKLRLLTYRPVPSNLPNGIGFAGGVYQYETYPSGSRWVLAKCQDDFLLKHVSIAIKLLSNPKVVFEMATDTDASLKVRNRHRMRGKPQVPTVRRQHL